MEEKIIPSNTLIKEAIKELSEKDKDLVIRAVATLRLKLFEMRRTAERLERENKCLYQLVIEKNSQLIEIDEREDNRESAYVYKENLAMLGKEEENE